MKELGYESMGEFGIPGRRYFRKNNAPGIRTHQVHAYDEPLQVDRNSISLDEVNLVAVRGV